MLGCWTSLHADWQLLIGIPAVLRPRTIFAVTKKRDVDVCFQSCLWREKSRVEESTANIKCNMTGDEMVRMTEEGEHSLLCSSTWRLGNVDIRSSG